MNPDPSYRFDVALSFAGDNKRDRIREIATALRHHLGNDRVFFDEWYEVELAGQDANLVLNKIYQKSSRLVVTCVCHRYGQKPWTQDEWRAIQALERTIRDASSDNIQRMRLLPLRFEDGEVDGLFDTAIVPDVRDRSVDEVVQLILDRLERTKGRGATTDLICQQGQSVVDELLRKAPADTTPVETGTLHYHVLNVEEQGQFRTIKTLLTSDLREAAAAMHSVQIWSVLGRYELLIRCRIKSAGTSPELPAIEKACNIGAQDDHNLSIKKEYSSYMDFAELSTASDVLSIERIRDSFSTRVFILVDYRSLPDARPEEWFVKQVLTLLKRDASRFAVNLVARGGRRMMIEAIIPCGRLRSLNRLSAALEELFASDTIKRTVTKETLIGYEVYDLTNDHFVRHDF